MNDSIHQLSKTRMVPVTLALLGAVALSRLGFSQCQTQKLVASDTEASDSYGVAVSIDGEWAAVGAYLEDDLVAESGAVYIYRKTGSTWALVQKLKASDSAFGSQFGWSLALAGDRLFIGAPTDTPQGLPQASGALYVFEQAGGQWSESAKLVSNDPDFDEHFGWSVSVSGARILVGTRDDTQSGFSSGAAHVFDLVGSTWMQSAKLTGSDTAAWDFFGESVSLSGDFALVGAVAGPGPSSSDQGAAYLFVRQGSVWVQVQKLVASDGLQNDFFGVSVALDDQFAIVDASGHDHPFSNSGTAYVYSKVGSNWIETQELIADDQALASGLGGRLSLSGDQLLIGTPGSNDSGGASGAAYHFRFSGSSWTQVGKLLGQDSIQGDNFGISAGLSGNTALVGAWGDDDACPDNLGCNSGSAYLFELAPSATQYGSCPTGAPCNNKDPHGGCRNSTGQGAVLAACGSGSVVTDDLRLEVTRCPPNKLTLLFMGPSQQSAIYGDGIRVVSAQNPTGIYRYGGAAADSMGRVMRGPGLVAHSQGFQPLGRIQSGQTWNFQFWYRDLQGPCGGLTNFSNGVQVSFGP